MTDWRKAIMEIDEVVEQDICKEEPNDWEIDFLDSIRDLDLLSSKQESKLNDIYEKVTRC